MRVYLAVAVLLLALIAFAEAQDDAMQQRFREFGDQITEVGKKAAVKFNEFADQAKDFGNDLFEKMKAGWGRFTN